MVAQAAVLIVPTLGTGSDSFKKKLKAELALVNEDLTVQVKADTAKMVAQIKAAKAWADGQEIDLKVNELGITKSITEIRHKYQDLQREMKKALILDLKVTGMALLPQLAQGLAAANASIVQLAQSATLLPGILSGVLSSVGALATGLGGVKDAFKEYGEAQKNAASEGLKARNAALNVNNAYRDLNRTVKDTKRSLEDMNAQLRDAPLDEADAIIRVQEARAEAADKAGKSGLQQQKDTLGLIKAENELADTRLRNSRLVEDVATANAKGVAGADAVADATDRLSKAMDDAATKSTKLTDSLKELSPNAQEFVTSVTGMSESWIGFKNNVQDKLFEGLGAEVVKLGQNDLPILQKGFSAIAGEINGNVKTAIASLQTDTNKGFLDRIFGNTADAQGRIDQSINPLIDAFLRLSAVGSDFLPRLADGLADVLTRFDNFIVRAESDGSLQEWMNSGIDALKQLGNSIINIGSMMSSLNDAFTGSGGNSMLEYLADASKRMADFMKSAEGQEQLKQFFMDTRAELAKWRPLLDALPDVLRNIADAGRAWADVLLPFLTSAGQLLAQHPTLVKAIFSAFLLWRNVVPTVTALAGGLKKVNEAFGKLNSNYPSFVGKTEAAKQKIGNLTSAIMSPAGLVAGVTAAALWIGTNMVTAHDDAKAAAQRQRDELDLLKGSLDEVTGAATNATKALIGQNLVSATNEATGENTQGLGKLLGNNAPSYVDAVKSGNVDAALSLIPSKATAEGVRAFDGGSFWKNNSQSLSEAGLSAEGVAAAINGEPDALKKWNDWSAKQNHIPGLPDSLTPGLMKSDILGRALGTQTPTLLDIQNSLPEQDRLGSVLSGETYTATAGVTAGGQEIRDRNQYAQGNYRLKPDSPFNALGVLAPPGMAADGSRAGLVTGSAPAQDTPQWQQFRDDGVSFKEDGPGRFIVELTPGAAAKYLDKYAAGGLISGPGSGTSDSIMARLSHGEYVVNAASTKNNLGLLESINSGSMPGFSVGGPVPLKPPPVVPIVPDIAPPSTPDPVKTAPAPAGGGGFSLPSIKDTLPKIGNFFQAALGLGTPEGYQETRTATVSTDKGIMTEPTAVTMSGLGDWTKQSTLPGVTKPGSLPSFVEDVTNNITGGKPPVAPASSAAVPAAPPKPLPVVPAVPAAPAMKPVTPASAPLAAESGYTGPQAHAIGSKPGPINPIQALPGMLSTPVAGPLVAAQLAPYAGLAVGSNINYGQAGFPDWVYQAGSKFGMSASTYAGHQEGSGANKGIDWAPSNVSWNTPQGAQMMTDYAKYLVSLGTMEQIIYQNPFTGETVGVANGRPVGPGTDQPDYYAADWGGHQDHIHTRTSLSVPLPEQLAGLAGSPSNMPLAGTPSGVTLPQFTFGDGAGGAGQLGNIDFAKVFDNYVKSVQTNWSSILDNLVKNAGSIAMKFLGSFFGIDLSPIMSIANSVMGDVGDGFDTLTGNGDGESGSGLAANSSVADILNSVEFGSLPPMYQNLLKSQLQAQGGDSAQAYPLLQQVMAMAQQQGAGSPAGYNPAGGAEQWRPVVQKALQERASMYGITNVKAWEDALVRQIQTESNGDPNSKNLNDTDGKGGTQQVFGLGNFLPSTFAAHNVTGGEITDGTANVYAMIDYVAKRYGTDASGAPLQIGRGVGYASGGKIKGKGTGKSDSILARVSNGEYIVKAGAASKHMGLLDAINSGSMPGFAEGGPIGPIPIVPPPPVTPPPPPSPVGPDPMGPTAGVEAGQPSAPVPDVAVNAPGDAPSNTLAQVGDVLSSVGQSVGGVATGAEAPAGASPTGDPRSALGAAPQNLDHNNPAVSKGIQAAGSAISSAISTAMSTAGMAGAGVGGGAASGAASSMISGLVNVGTGAATGAVNILSSLLVGTATRNGTAGAYGTPLTPDANGQKPYAGPSVVNNWNGGVHTSNNDEFYKIQQRRELQNAAPMLANR